MTNCLSLKRSTILAAKYNHVATHKLLYTARSLDPENKHQFYPASNHWTSSTTSYFTVFLIPQL